MLGFRFRPNGMDPDSSIFEVLSLRHPDDDYQPAAAAEVPYSRDPAERLRTWGPVLHQDFANLEKLQRGMHATSLPEIRLAGYQEQLIAHFHRTIDAYLERHEDSEATLDA
jgi:hypothetical protein